MWSRVLCIYNWVYEITTSMDNYKIECISHYPNRGKFPWTLSLSAFVVILIFEASVEFGLSKSLTRPRKLNGMGRMLSLDRRRENREEDIGFVSRSASWSWVEIKCTSSVLATTMSLTKWKSISTCLVLAWKTRLEERYIAPMLSHQRVGEVECEKPSSRSRDWSHLISATALARALYLALVLDRATVAYFLQLQEIKLRPRKTQ